MGESAAGAMVDALLQSSAFNEEHLFQRVVISSGVAATPKFGIASSRFIVANSLAVLTRAFGDDDRGDDDDDNDDDDGDWGNLTKINGNDAVILHKLRRLKKIDAKKLLSYSKHDFYEPYPFRPFRAGELFENTEDSNFVSEKSFSEKNVSILMGWTSFENAFFYGQKSTGQPFEWTDEGDH